MKPSDNKEKLYHQIALACLKALKNPSGDSQQHIQQVYEAIDSAFNQQFALLAHELDSSKQKLADISALDPNHHNLQDAQQIASADGSKH